MYPNYLQKNASIPGAMINAGGLGVDLASEIGPGIGDFLGNVGSSFADTYGQLPLEAQIGLPSSLLLLESLRRLRKKTVKGNEKRYAQYLAKARENSNLRKQLAVKSGGPLKTLGALGLGAGAALGGKLLYDHLSNRDDASTLLPGGFNRNKVLTALGGASTGATAGYGLGRYYDPEQAHLYALGGGLAGGIGGYAAQPSLEKILSSLNKPASSGNNFITSALQKESCGNFVTKPISVKKASTGKEDDEEKKSCSNFVTKAVLGKKSLLDNPTASLLGMSSGGFLGYGLGNVISDKISNTPENTTIKNVLPSLAAVLGGAGGAVGVDELIKKIDAKRVEKEQAERALQQLPQALALSPELLQLLALQRNY